MLKVTIFSKIEFGRFCLYYIVYCSYDNANWQQAGEGCAVREKYTGRACIAVGSGGGSRSGKT